MKSLLKAAAIATLVVGMAGSAYAEKLKISVAAEP